MTFASLALRILTLGCLPNVHLQNGEQDGARFGKIPGLVPPTRIQVD